MISHLLFQKKTKYRPSNVFIFILLIILYFVSLRLFGFITKCQAGFYCLPEALFYVFVDAIIFALITGVVFSLKYRKIKYFFFGLLLFSIVIFGGIYALDSISSLYTNYTIGKIDTIKKSSTLTMTYKNSVPLYQDNVLKELKISFDVTPSLSGDYNIWVDTDQNMNGVDEGRYLFDSKNFSLTANQTQTIDFTFKYPKNIKNNQQIYKLIVGGRRINLVVKSFLTEQKIDTLDLSVKDSGKSPNYSFMNGEGSYSINTNSLRTN